MNENLYIAHKKTSTQNLVSDVFGCLCHVLSAVVFDICVCYFALIMI